MRLRRQLSRFVSSDLGQRPCIRNRKTSWRVRAVQILTANAVVCVQTSARNSSWSNFSLTEAIFWHLIGGSGPHLHVDTARAGPTKGSVTGLWSHFLEPCCWQGGTPVRTFVGRSRQLVIARRDFGASFQAKWCWDERQGMTGTPQCEKTSILTRGTV